MKYYQVLIVLILFSCNSSQTNDEPQQPVSETASVPGPTRLETNIHNAIVLIETKDIELSGNKIIGIPQIDGSPGDVSKSLQLDGMEVTKISYKEFLNTERDAQVRDFKRFMNYLDKFKNPGKALENYNKRIEYQAKHDAVLTYLDNEIKKASSLPTVYRVSYYFKAHTRDVEYNQLQTRYLDENLKKLEMNYSHLKIAF